eukprot:Em0008g783a
MKNPVQTECGHLFCRACLEPVLRSHNPLCPIENSPVSRDTAFPDNACKREILALEVYCDNKDSGCPWIGLLKGLEDHAKICEFGTSLCCLCGLSVLVKSLPFHEKEECSMRLWICIHCDANVRLSDKEAHIKNECPEYLRLCPNGCDSTLKMKLFQLEAHLDPRIGNCPRTEISCPFKPYGCNFVSQRLYMASHYKENEVHHIHLQADCWTETKKQVDKDTSALEHLSDRVSTMEAHITSAEDHQNALRQRVETSGDRTGQGHWGSLTPSWQDQVTQLNIAVKEVENKLMESEIRTKISVSPGYHSAAKIGSEVCVSTHEIDTVQAKVSELDHGLDRCLSSCLDQELRLQLLERATYNGVLLWKIDDFARRRKEAVDGVTMSLYSIPFYTSRHGYKMCARVYLNGDGMGKGTHLSFFFVVMKGPFDALLPWPFKQKVTLTIINQAGKKHVTDTFRPDPQSNSFQRPTQKEMNVASGCPMFIRQDQLLNGGCVKEDCIFLRVVVDTMDLPQFIP